MKNPEKLILIICLIFPAHIAVKLISALILSEVPLLSVAASSVFGFAFAIAMLNFYYTKKNSKKQLATLRLIQLVIPFMYVTTTTRVLMYGASKWEMLFANLCIVVYTFLFVTKRRADIKQAEKLDKIVRAKIKEFHHGK